jgi:hypothetical protein
MSSLTPEERAAIVEAASAILSAKERMVLYKEDAAEELRGKPGYVPASTQKVESVMVPGRKLLEVLVAIMRYQPGLPAVRFRGHLFALILPKGPVPGLTVMKEVVIDTVEE